MDILSPTVLTALLCLVSTALTQDLTDINTASNSSTSLITSVSTPTTNVSTPTTYVSTPTTSVSTPTTSVSTQTTSVSIPPTSSSTVFTSSATPTSTSSTSGSTSTASTSGSTPTAITFSSTPNSTASTSGSTPSSAGSSLPPSTASPTSADKIPQWYFQKDEFYCIVLQMQTQIYFNLYIANVIENLNFSLDEVNTNTDKDSSRCDGLLVLKFKGSLNGTKVYPLTGSLKFNFQNQSTSVYDLVSIELVAEVEKQEIYGQYNASIKVPMGSAHQCLSEVKWKFSDNVTLDLQKFEFEAFMNSTTTTLKKFDICSLDDHTSDVVPIAVGCALAALVVIILIAYLIGRRRNRQRGLWVSQE